MGFAWVRRRAYTHTSTYKKKQLKFWYHTDATLNLFFTSFFSFLCNRWCCSLFSASAFSHSCRDTLSLSHTRGKCMQACTPFVCRSFCSGEILQKYLAFGCLCNKRFAQLFVNAMSFSMYYTHGHTVRRCNTNFTIGEHTQNHQKRERPSESANECVRFMRRT